MVLSELLCTCKMVLSELLCTCKFEKIDENEVFWAKNREKWLFLVYIYCQTIILYFYTIFLYVRECK